MKAWKSFLSVGLSLGIYATLWVALYPWFRYALDSDAVAYLTLAEQGAQGVVWRSINGLWSGLNSWLLIPFIQQGYAAWPTALALNAFFGGVLLLQGYHFISRFKFGTASQVMYLSIMPLIIVYWVYFQVFGDVLQMIFVLAYLHLIIHRQAFQHLHWLLLGTLLMGIGFYAKAYTFFYFFLFQSIGFFFLYRKKLLPIKHILLNFFGSSLVFVLCLLPNAVLLYKKYGLWAPSGLAGKLNMSWYINSGKSFKSDIGLLIPPAYPDSPSFWEDPYLSQDHLSSPLSSLTHFVKWVSRVAYTSLEGLVCINEVSILGVALLVLLFGFMFNRKYIPLPILLVLLAAIGLPLGYFLMHIETRYIWLLTFLLLALACYVLQMATLKPWLRKLGYGIIGISFLVHPIMELKSLRNKNKDLFEKAAWLKQLGIEGSFTSNITDVGQYWVIAYLNHMQYYTIERTDYTQAELESELARYQLKYYLFQAENAVVPLLLPQEKYTRIDSRYGISVYKIKYDP
jgi:hypothetical protein